MQREKHDGKDEYKDEGQCKDKHREPVVGQCRLHGKEQSSKQEMEQHNLVAATPSRKTVVAAAGGEGWVVWQVLSTHLLYYLYRAQHQPPEAQSLPHPVVSGTGSSEDCSALECSLFSGPKRPTWMKKSDIVSHKIKYFPLLYTFLGRRPQPLQSCSCC